MLDGLDIVSERASDKLSACTINAKGMGIHIANGATETYAKPGMCATPFGDLPDAYVLKDTLVVLSVGLRCRQ